MSYRRSEQSPTPSNKKFVPDLNALESRLLLSRQVPFPDGTSFVFPSFVHLPRTGGVALQSGTALTVGVGQPTTNTAHVSFTGAGAATVEWNGRAPQSFTSVQAILVQAGRAGHDHVTFQLNTSPTLVVSSHEPTAAVGANAITRPVHDFVRRTSGTAVQSGTLLTITVTARKINTVEISSLNFGTVVQAEWNGGTVHNFTGVNTIIVNTKNGARDLVGLDNGTAKGP
jgi:hypothetical protein